MSVDASAWAWRQPGLTRSEKLLLLAIADHADPAGECYPSRGRLAAMCGFESKDPNDAKRTVTKVARSLERKVGLFRIPRHRDSNGSQTSTLYRLPLEEGVASGTRGGGESDTGGVAARPTPEPSVEPSPEQTPPTPSPEARGLSAEVEEVFAFWLETFGGTRKSTPKRRKAIEARLNEGFDVDYLKTAIKGCAGSAFHMKKGEHAERPGPVYSDLTLIARNPEQLEKFHELGGAKKRPRFPGETKAKPADRAEDLRRQIRSWEFDLENDPDHPFAAESIADLQAELAKLEEGPS